MENRKDDCRGTLMPVGRPTSFYVNSQGFWLRIFGYGFSISTDPLLFSERYGYTKVWILGKFKIKPLYPLRKI